MKLSHFSHIFLLAFMLFLPAIAQAQFGSIDVRTVNVDVLSDDQIRQIWTRAQQENMTVNEVVTVGQAQGLPASEAEKLRTRLNQAAAGQLSGAATNGAASQARQPSQMMDADEIEIIPSDEDLPEPVTPEEPQDPEFIPIYGHSIFTDQSLDIFTTTDAARAPDSYILGSGDQIRVIIFGTSQADLLLEINEDGYVQPSGMPRIFVKGLSMKEARQVLRERLSAFFQFRSDEIAITIRTARSITINIFGETEVRGGFTISALNTAFNALSAAGGPTEIGSVRDIRVIRGDQRSTIDVYEFLRNPSAGSIMDLQHNDIIFVPVAEKVVRISGSVRRPMRYELKSGEGVLELIQFAGGINFDTSPDFVQVQRIVNDEPKLMDFRLTDILSGSERVELRDGDIVRIRPIGRELENFVEITGSVFYPGQYNLDQTGSIRTLIDRAGLREQAKTDMIFVERILPDSSIRIVPVAYDELLQTGTDLQLERRDNVIVFDKQRYRDVADIQVTGNVRNPFSRELQFDERLRIREALELAGGLQPTAAARGYIFRTDVFNPEFVTHIPVNLISEGDVQLQPGDRLVVYDQSMYSEAGELSISGAVQNPFDTAFDPELTPTDLLIMANGFQRGAALNRIDVFRMDVSISRGVNYSVITLQADSLYNITAAPEGFRLQPFDRVVVRRIPEFNVGLAVTLEGEARYPGTYPLANRRTHLSDVINQAGGLTSVADPSNAIIMRSQGNTVGPIAVNLSRAMASRRDGQLDPVLFPDDIIMIPRFNNIVSIRVEATRVGELQQQGVVDDETLTGELSTINVVYQGSRSAKWYIENFGGGFAEDADRWSVTVTLPNGQVRGTKRTLLFFRNYPAVEPGSTISLRLNPEVLQADMEEGIDWDRVYQRSIQTTTSLLTILILLDQLSN
ncbi:MAG: SLBB domain-containing protein [Bacteroidetes bacterium]|nr:SLBB domain-containing protein [Bacteroidota bacterium]